MIDWKKKFKRTIPPRLLHKTFSWYWKWFRRRTRYFWIDIHKVRIFWNFTFQNIPKENGKENTKKMWLSSYIKFWSCVSTINNKGRWTFFSRTGFQWCGIHSLDPGKQTYPTQHILSNKTSFSNCSRSLIVYDLLSLTDFMNFLFTAILLIKFPIIPRPMRVKTSPINYAK